MSSTQPSKSGAPSSAGEKDASEVKEQPKANAPLEEDDEFEDFPATDWEITDTEGQQALGGRLWEESWDDDDNSEDFATQLRFASAPLFDTSSDRLTARLIS